jgi:hypothetical protein
MSCNNVQILNFNHNVVEVGSDNKLIITDNVRCNSITIPQPVTNILQINSPGPQGPAGTGGGGSTDTGSLLTTASVVLNTITFTKGNGSTFPITVNTGSGGIVSGDYVTTSSFNTFTSSYNTFSSSYNTGSFSGSFVGTASWAYSASVAISSSYALSASYADTASLAPNYVLNSATSSFVQNSQTSSFVTNSQTSSFVTNSQTSSFVTNSQTSSMTVATASYVTASAVNGTVTSASYALTASYAMDAGTTINTGSFVTTSSFNTFTSSFNTFTSSYNTGSFSGSFTGSLQGTASWAYSSSVAISSSYATSASYALTASSVVGATPTEVGYLSGVTSTIQTQINSKGYTLALTSLQSNLNTGTPYYFGNLGRSNSTTADQSRVYIPKTGIIKKAYITSYSATTGTITSITVSIRLNNTTDTLVASSIASAIFRTYNNNALSISVTEGDYIEMKVISTNTIAPTLNIFSGTLYIE